MLKRIILLPLLCCLLFASCSKPENLQKFDSETWIADTNGCNGKRQEMVAQFDSIRKDLYGIKEYVLRDVLGKPDDEELLTRNQRLYYYYLEPGTQCTESGVLPEANRVEVHVNAVGKVSEVTYKNPINK
jgi:hypothetical protein